MKWTVVALVLLTAITFAAGISVLDAQVPQQAGSQSAEQRIAALEKEVQLLRTELRALQLQLERLGSVTRPTPRGQGPSASTPSGEAPETLIEADCRSIMNAYETNEFAAAAKYARKVIVVTGRIREIGKRTYDPYRDLPFVHTVDVGGNSCLFFFPRGTEAALASLAPGQQVTIQGQVDAPLQFHGLALINSRLR